MSIGDTERTTQNRVVDFFKNRDILDYKYLKNDGLAIFHELLEQPQNLLGNRRASSCCKAA